MGKPVGRFIAMIAFTLLVVSSQTAPATAGNPAGTDPPGTAPRLILGDATTHDPAIVRSGRDWYVFSTGDPAVGGGAVQMRSSPDGRHWDYRGTVTPAIPAWVTAAVPGVANLWAPDVSLHDGIWYLYYAASTFGSNRSVIGLLTSPTLDPADPAYHWSDQGLVTESFATDDFNAIDPSLTTDAQGRAWLSFGSFWSGIKLTEVFLPSGKPATSHPVHTDLVDRAVPPDAVEAPYIVRHGDWYYLFASFDFCCQGVNSTYRVVVGRAATITGPYVDRNGTPLQHGGGSPFLDAQGAMRGPGGESVTGDTFAFHYYDAANNGTPHLGLGQLAWRNGWPVLTQIRI
jgi:arabinan endo-1,5-alpha-L-arabinosidase